MNFEDLLGKDILLLVKSKDAGYRVEAGTLKIVFDNAIYIEKAMNGCIVDMELIEKKDIEAVCYYSDEGIVIEHEGGKVIIRYILTSKPIEEEGLMKNEEV